MDKKTLEIAEQVGAFLIPILQAAVDSRFATNTKAFTDAVLAVSERTSAMHIEGMKAVSELTAVVQSVSVRVAAVAEEQQRSADFIAGVATTADLEAVSKGYLASVGDLRATIQGVEKATEIVSRQYRETVALFDERFKGLQGVVSHRVEDAIRSVSEVRDSVAREVRQSGHNIDALHKEIDGLRQKVDTAAGDASTAGTLAKEVEASVETLVGAEICKQLDALQGELLAGVSSRIDPVVLSLENRTKEASALAQQVAEQVKGMPAVPTAEEVAKLVTLPAMPTAGEVAKLVPVPSINLDAIVAQAGATVTEELKNSVQLIRSSVASQVSAEVVKAVAEVELPKIDMDGLVSQLQLHIDSELDQAVPALKRSLQVNVSDEVSKAVAALPRAKDGAAGVLPIIENYVDGRLYERGAAVFALGGTWQALAPTKTPPAPDTADWRAIAVGVAGIDTEVSTDLRSVGFAVRLTDGTTVTREVLSPSLLYQGIFEEAKVYNPMDVTTHAGSMWVAVAGAEAGEVPGKSAAWTLCVKRGVDGRTAKDTVQTIIKSAGYSGDYEEGRVYQKDSLVTYASSLWLSKQPTKERPPYMSNLDENEHWLRVR